MYNEEIEVHQPIEGSEDTRLIGRGRPGFGFGRPGFGFGRPGFGFVGRPSFGYGRPFGYGYGYGRPFGYGAGPFLGGVAGGLLGSALLQPYGGYGYYGSPYGYGYGYGYNPYYNYY